MGCTGTVTLTSGSNYAYTCGSGVSVMSPPQKSSAAFVRVTCQPQALDTRADTQVCPYTWMPSKHSPL